MSETKLREPSLIPTLQADALAREIERQLQEESGAMIAAAQRDADTTVGKAHKVARARLRQAITDLRREGERRMTHAKAKLETATRARQQQQANRAIAAASPLLHEALDARWRDSEARCLWTGAVANLCVTRLRPGSWTIEHPASWTAQEQGDFTAALAGGAAIAVTYVADDAMSAGLRIKADHAVLDATIQGLLSDGRTIAAMILDQLDRGASP